jgi:hypothetical protein
VTDSDPAPALTPELTITDEDIVELNRATVLRAAAFASIGGSVILAAGVVGALAWLWLTVRNQQHIEGSVFGFGDSEDAAFVDRVDAFASYMPMLMYASLAVAAGFGLRMLSDYAVVRTGGSLTGFEVGDRIDEIIEDDGSTDT